ncbi:NAD-binding D-isomer specific 2-hydroxyacid dehydrogenase protein [Fictibacillus macauensis ZFHKF-1]|uniref:NAD-binding D-isomer specific 2-hydroxyacid dehydrogenase protein n=1 Tax=Fictibacillus macauensis ZFHKF-1 TaxID=1196324 RepID=I8AFU6_9BACL|nr:D-2-hydroxyacid dehydrogenase family protein [Fictibacillus macauensis]EIT84259.1 NAD-binding D-isomer specific 2-hydroxyacid dehydrogenase protein [Fictibacillus macauensis ZFHKF-1]
MRLKCAILDDYQRVALEMADWSVLHDTVEITTFHEHMNEEIELVKALQDFDMIVIMRERTPFPKSLLEKLPRLKLLITSGMRNASIDIEAAAAQGVVVCGTASHSEPPVELTWALLLSLARNIHVETTAFQEGGPWQSTVGSDLSGRTLGLLGLGKTGQKMAHIAQAFGMKVIAWSQNLTQARADEVGVQLAQSKEELLTTSDFVSIHLVLSERTRHLISKHELALMRPTAYLINTSRSRIIDTSALIAALQTNEIAGAAIDVFDTEPLPATDLLRTLPTLLATPHLGYVTRRNYETYFTQAIEDIQAFVKNEPIRTLY